MVAPTGHDQKKKRERVPEKIWDWNGTQAGVVKSTTIPRTQSPVSSTAVSAFVIPVIVALVENAGCPDCPRQCHSLVAALVRC